MRPEPYQTMTMYRACCLLLSADRCTDTESSSALSPPLAARCAIRPIDSARAAPWESFQLGFHFSCGHFLLSFDASNESSGLALRKVRAISVVSEKCALLRRRRLRVALSNKSIDENGRSAACWR